MIKRDWKEEIAKKHRKQQNREIDKDNIHLIIKINEYMSSSLVKNVKTTDKFKIKLLVWVKVRDIG